MCRLTSLVPGLIAACAARAFALRNTVRRLMDCEAVGRKAYARIGLLGNPSDGYHGKTISVAVANFWAEVTLRPSERIGFTPHPVHDPLSFTGLDALAERLEREGYYGGVRLLMAICKVFVQHCTAKGIPLHTRGFNLSYETNIPRQAGLSGSSAIVCAALSCLMEHYQVSDRLPLEERPNLILQAEQQELGITAGLQDRVIQVYGGAVYMDFDEPYMREHGHGRYERMDASILPPLWLLIDDRPSDSARIHAPVRKLWEAGDAIVRQAMHRIAECAEAGRHVLDHQHKFDAGALGELMDENFNLRRKTFGDAALGEHNLKMVELARQFGGSAKFAGSGGAVVVWLREGADISGLQAACEDTGFTLVQVQVAPPTSHQQEL
ncbi:hypothetical protein WJX73_000302 [Symbiochloris irregularis]|uniref:GHMP kinase N-terminal domain-containing protein n=1 Tax=Symbiochloris irregularis TaxID=706552 RepID=A0AAW1NNR3_9CHLO